MFKPRSSKDVTFNLGTPLETKGFTPKARKAMFKLATNISRMVRIARNTGVVWLSREPVRGRVQQEILRFMLNDCSQQKRYDQFMRISDNNTEHSSYQNFDLTRMFNKQCFVIQRYQTAMVDYI